jgi:hypothetical protein
MPRLATLPALTGFLQRSIAISARRVALCPTRAKHGRGPSGRTEHDHAEFTAARATLATPTGFLWRMSRSVWRVRHGGIRLVHTQWSAVLAHDARRCAADCRAGRKLGPERRHAPQRSAADERRPTARRAAARTGAGDPGRGGEPAGCAPGVARCRGHGDRAAPLAIPAPTSSGDRPIGAAAGRRSLRGCRTAGIRSAGRRLCARAPAGDSGLWQRPDRGYTRSAGCACGLAPRLGEPLVAR